MSAAQTDVVLAIDPGSDKCGVAVVRQSGEVITRSVVPTATLVTIVRELVERYLPSRVVCGNGTGSKPIIKQLALAGLSAIDQIDEAYTSEEARRRFVEENPPRGLARLLPKSLRTPTVPYDDYVATILAERYWLQLDSST